MFRIISLQLIVSAHIYARYLRFLQRLTLTAWSSDIVHSVAAIFRVCPQRLYAFTTREHRFTFEKILGAALICMPKQHHAELLQRVCVHATEVTQTARC